MSLQYVRVSAVWRAGAAPADAVTAAPATTTTPMANHHLADLCMCRLLPWLCGNRVEDRVEHACGPVTDDVVGGKAGRGLGFGDRSARRDVVEPGSVERERDDRGRPHPGRRCLVEAHDLRKRRDRRLRVVLDPGGAGAVAEQQRIGEGSM